MKSLYSVSKLLFLNLIIRPILILIQIIMFPILYLFRYKGNIWNKYQDCKCKLKFLNNIFGNDEDGIFFDPRVVEKLKRKNSLPKYFKRCKFTDFVIWNLRNPIHNWEILTGIKTENIKEVKLYKSYKSKRYFIQIFEAIDINNKYYFIKVTIYFLNKKLEFYMGPRINDLILFKKFNKNYAYTNWDYSNYKGKYIQYRGYKVIRNGFALRLKSTKR